MENMEDVVLHYIVYFPCIAAVKHITKYKINLINILSYLC